MSTALPVPRISPDEYLRREREAPERSEYVNGEIYSMGGASRAHNLVAGNCFAELRARLGSRSCETYVSDMRVRVSETGLYTYPDLVVACEPPRWDDSHFDTLPNPILILEVLSECTERYDRGEKFAHYRRLPSLREYLLVAQDRYRVEHFARDGESWVLTEFSGLGAEVPLPALQCTLPLSVIYERVTVDDTPPLR